MLPSYRKSLPFASFAAVLGLASLISFADCYDHFEFNCCAISKAYYKQCDNGLQTWTCDGETFTPNPEVGTWILGENGEWASNQNHYTLTQCQFYAPDCGQWPGTCTLATTLSTVQCRDYDVPEPPHPLCVE